MRTSVFTLGIVLALAVLATFGANQAQAGERISVTFTNRTDVDVTFHLNGGKGLRTSLRPGQRQTYRMVVDNDGYPLVGIYQSSGKRQDFCVEDGRCYYFGVQNGKIISFFE